MKPEVESKEYANLVRVQLLVQKSNKRVLHMEAGKDFVDVLFSFLMLPIGAVIKLISQGLDEWPVGAISNIFKSIEKLNASIMNVSYKDVLLSPQPASGYCASSLVRIQGITSCEMAYYTCNNYHCAEFKTQAIMTRKHGHPCASCRNPMTKEFTESQESLAAKSMSKPAEAPAITAGYVKENITFMITDDMEIYPTSTIKSSVLLNKLKVENMSDLDNIEIAVGITEVKFHESLPEGLPESSALSLYLVSIGSKKVVQSLSKSGVVSI